MIEPEFRTAMRSIPLGASVCQVKAPDGWPLRMFDWPCADGVVPRGSILFQSGRADFFEKYLEFFADMHAAGWSVTAFDWRGQGGSGRLLADKLIGHAEDYSVWTADLASFWNDWKTRTPAPHMLIGHSMGGHLSLRTVMEHRLEPDALVLVAPMLGFHSLILPQFLIGLATRLVSRLRPRRRAWPDAKRGKAADFGRRMLLTHDKDRYEDELWWRAHNPELALGAPSLSWLAEAYRSFNWMWSKQRLESLDLPVLILMTSADKLVTAKAIRQFSARICRVHLKVFGREAAHELLREADPVRSAAITEISAFLDRQLNAR